MKTRCSWVNLNNDLYVKYHDEEWGVPVFDDKKLFEFLILEGAQAGLSWETILKRRESYRKAFANWNVNIVANFSEDETQELLNNPGIIRNKLKIKSVVKNAKAFIKIQKEFGSFSKYIWQFLHDESIKNKIELSKTVSKDLKKRGMSFVGPTIIYAYFQATGMVNDHTADCFRYNEV